MAGGGDYSMETINRGTAICGALARATRAQRSTTGKKIRLSLQEMTDSTAQKEVCEPVRLSTPT